jgi:hypothetical protein
VVKRIGEFFDSDIAAAHKIHKSLTGKKRAALADVEARIATLKSLMGAYSEAQEAIRRAAEREAQAAAMQAEADRVAREAAALESAGDHALAAAVVEEHLAAPPVSVSVPSTTPRLAGVATVEQWAFEIVNAALIPRQYLMVDEKKIGATVRAFKGDTKIPGVRVVRRTAVRVSA